MIRAGSPLSTYAGGKRGAHQRDELGELGDEVEGEDGPEDGPPPEGVAQRFGVADGGVEGGPLVVDAKGDKLDYELDQEAHRVDQIGLEVRVGLLHLVLRPPGIDSVSAQQFRERYVQLSRRIECGS